MSEQVKSTIKEVFEELADALESGQMGPKFKIGLTINGSEHGDQVMKEAAEAAKKDNLFDLVLIGSAYDWTDQYELYQADDEQSVSDKVEELLADGTIQGCVTLHHAFPIGVSTVGRVQAPANGKDVFIATTTGTTATNREEAMVLNAINGITAAKACGYDKPTLGILNVDGANKVERSLKELQSKGYEFTFGESKRADGGAILRGNDLLQAAVDVVVTDTLTGNLLMKVFSAFNTGGSYEATGYGYGPSIGEGYEFNICIVSRASGANVIKNALTYAYEVAKGDLIAISEQEYAAAKKAGLDQIRDDLQVKSSPAAEEEVSAPEKEIVSVSIAGIDVLDLEEAVQACWKAGIYAESGMGCTGPVVMVNEAKEDQAKEAIKEAGFI